ncbi:hypothetical protein GVN16_24475 [Emticicia sp. CRIBPO]|uniref:hypothetical protein n=1 Tax=Emticicia sp. CRIBPO TaxID=2683258 RepID=UPI0014123BFC|nr:hypothetical protein [Emticicia sp. CRIBPO]NBA88954.1 hypothetical protein [Emticicia sp. CRIBPO]
MKTPRVLLFIIIVLSIITIVFPPKPPECWVCGNGLRFGIQLIIPALAVIALSRLGKESRLK